MSLFKTWPVAAALAVAGCGTIPDLTVNYYFPRAKSQFAVTQTVGCSPKVAGQHRIIRSVISVSQTTTYGADLDWKSDDGSVRQGHLSYRAFRGTFSDADANVALTPDGRLAGVNASSTGQGDAIIKNLVTLAGTVALFAAPPGAGFVATVEDRACDQIDKYAAVPSAAGDSKAASLLTLSYSLAVNYKVSTGSDPVVVVDSVSSPGYDGQPGNLASISLVPDPASKPAYDALKAVLGDRMNTVLKVTSTKASLRVMSPTSPTTVKTSDGVALELNKVGIVNLEIDGHAGDLLQSSQVWGAALPVPMQETYQVPIPSPATFGKTAFGIALSDYGSITTLHYGETSGAPDATDAMGQIAKALQPKSPEDQATALKGQADLIAQQQRLIGCEVAPTNCK